MTYSSVPKFDVKVTKVRLGDVENGFPGVEAFGHEHLGVLGKTQSRQAFFQVAHVEGRHRQILSEWCRGNGDIDKAAEPERCLEPILPTQDGGWGGSVP